MAAAGSVLEKSNNNSNNKPTKLQGLTRSLHISPYEAINPSLYSNFQVVSPQQLLAGFGISANERYTHIAKKNLQITNLAFRAQVIATVTQVENIYWDLENAYLDEQVKERSLAFAQRTLQDDRKQLRVEGDSGNAGRQGRVGRGD